MKYETKIDAQKANIYYVVFDPFGSEFYPMRFSTEAEARKEKRESNIGGDLGILMVNMKEEIEELL